MPVVVRPGDCLDVMRTMPDASVHAIVTDPPYNLAFMSREWDTHATPRDFQDWCKLWAAECLRVLRPGGYLLAFGGTRTFHRLACAVEDAGFEIRDSIAWLYGSGFPKSLDVGKAIDKAKSPDVAADIEHVRGFLEAQWRRSGIKSAEVDAAFGFRGNMSAPHWFYKTSQNTVPTAEQWPTLLRLLGVALGDVPESVQAAADRVLAQRGLPGPAWALREVIGTRAVQDIRNGHGRAYGGAMFAGEDTGKIEHHVTAPATSAAREWAGWGTALKPSREDVVVARKPLGGSVAGNVQEWGCGALNIDAAKTADGRWPPNVVMDGSQADILGSKACIFPTFRYQAKAPTSERPSYVTEDGRKVAHPTVKPLGLMRWLVRLVTPPGGTVLDPFAGSGPTVEACLIEGFDCIAIERDPESLPLIQIRIDRQAGTLPFEDVS